jgi:hypothetical protein
LNITTEGKRLGRPRCRWEDIIKMYLKQEWEVENRINLAQDKAL